MSSLKLLHTVYLSHSINKVTEHPWQCISLIVHDDWIYKRTLFWFFLFVVFRSLSRVHFSTLETLQWASAHCEMIACIMHVCLKGLAIVVWIGRGAFESQWVNQNRQHATSVEGFSIPSSHLGIINLAHNWKTEWLSLPCLIVLGPLAKLFFNCH